MQRQVKFQTEVRTVPFGDGTIIIENLTPILPPKERERRKREIEKRLYDVFSKYTKAGKTGKATGTNTGTKPIDNIVGRG